MDSMNADSIVAEGAAMLDGAHPGWREAIKVEAIDIRDVAQCILGQLYGGYGRGLSNLGLSSNSARSHGFSAGHEDAETITAAWKRLLAKPKFLVGSLVNRGAETSVHRVEGVFVTRSGEKLTILELGLSGDKFVSSGEYFSRSDENMDWYAVFTPYAPGDVLRDQNNRLYLVKADLRIWSLTEGTWSAEWPGKNFIQDLTSAGERYSEI